MVSTVNYSATVCELAKCQADFQSLHVWGPGLYLDEPRLRVTATGKLNVPDSRFDVGDVTLTANDVSARITDASFAFSGKPGAQQRVNAATLQCNLGTLHRWTQNPRDEGSLRMSGLVSAKLSANLANSAPALDLDVTVDNLEAIPRAGQPWREKQVHLVASGKYDEPTDTVQLARCELASEAVQLAASGRVERWSKDRQLQLSGQSKYDLEKISVLLKPYLGDEVQLTGRETHSFSLSGPIGALASAETQVKPAAVATAPGQQPMSFDFLKELTGKAEAGWQSANVFGFAVGTAKLNSTLANGVFDLQPTTIGVSGGRLNLAARAVLSPGPATLYLPKGPLIQQAEVTEGMCHQWLMYMAPVFADATETTGKFSVALNGSQIPLDNPRKADVDGRVTIHSVEIGPNPLVRELQILLGRGAQAKMSKEANIDFRLYNERVYHQNLELHFPEFTLRTSGSVGLDETLQVTAELPIPPKWLREGPVGDALKGVVIRLPIGGTLHKPKIDQKAIDQAFADVAKKLLDGGLKNELGRQLDRLDRLIPGLQPRQP
jgi:translocation and assembly module TamB